GLPSRGPPAPRSDTLPLHDALPISVESHAAANARLAAAERAQERAGVVDRGRAADSEAEALVVLDVEGRTHWVVEHRAVADPDAIGRAHVRRPVTFRARMTSEACHE